MWFEYMDSIDYPLNKNPIWNDYWLTMTNTAKQMSRNTSDNDNDTALNKL